MAKQLTDDILDLLLAINMKSKTKIKLSQNFTYSTKAKRIIRDCELIYYKRTKVYDEEKQRNVVVQEIVRKQGHLYLTDVLQILGQFYTRLSGDEVLAEGESDD